MFDRDELDRLLTPRFGYGGLPTDKAFEYVRDHGWCPRHPRLPGPSLLVARGVGDCLDPVVLDGDELFIDLQAYPRSGDLVYFRVAARAARDLNRELPAGRPPWVGGGYACKLLVQSRGHDMLVERFGGAVSTVRFACESDDETPLLFPVVNIRRYGRLLFE